MPSNTQPGVGWPPRRTPAAPGHEEPKGKQRGGDPGEAEEKQQSGDEAKERPGDHMPRAGACGADQAGGAPAPGMERPGTRGGRAPRTGTSRVNKQDESRTPGLERPGESGGQKGRRQEDEAGELLRCRQDPMQLKGQCNGDAQKQR